MLEILRLGIGKPSVIAASVTIQIKTNRAETFKILRLFIFVTSLKSKNKLLKKLLKLHFQDTFLLGVTNTNKVINH